jgi:hypothetical protein
MELMRILFARAEGRAVAHNLFLDGNTFSSGPHVSRIPLVAETQMGAGMGWRRLGLRLHVLVHDAASSASEPRPTNTAPSASRSKPAIR